METLYRPVAADLEIRSTAEGDSTGRLVHGILVPWNHRQRIDDQLVEQFERGGADHVIAAGERGRAPGGLPAYRMHFAAEHVRQGGRPVGRTELLRDDSAGLYGEWRVSRTPAGDELVELIKDGVYRELSVGFRSAPGWSRRLQDGTVSRTRFDPFEAAAVLRGAYGEAALVGGLRADLDGAEPAERPRLRAAQLAMAGWPVAR